MRIHLLEDTTRDQVAEKVQCHRILEICRSVVALKRQLRRQVSTGLHMLHKRGQDDGAPQIGTLSTLGQIHVEVLEEAVMNHT